MDFRQRLCHVRLAANAGWIGRRADDHKVVVEDSTPLAAMAIFDKYLLSVRCVGEQDVSVTPAPHGQGLSCPDSHNFDVNAGLLLEQWYEYVKQAAVPRASGGGERNRRA